MRVNEDLQEDLLAIGDKLRRWRMVRELPAAIVAERAGISASTLRALERGESAGTGLAALVSVVNVLGIKQPFIESLEPLNTDIGRIRADRMLRKRAPK